MGLRQAPPNDPDTSSPIRKDGHSAAHIAMKEARDLKHKANRLKVAILVSYNLLILRCTSVTIHLQTF